ncbi:MULTISPECIES: antibiotic biosynthesis monooxygenase family protein [Saccharibacillus]|uniref:antibiotic biosynthesis monooxygenase family protein n=1 Tax=Saccharibacillus TaxID=456492 RepID=UPI001239FC47|nr:antibiotic biosynthesis monooxygenase [Saccharibacillus sp. WB 17]MWJ33099.1 antibiotic biosynthesis monooxygenase [Saccharibacillus sp. WB 17]
MILEAAMLQVKPGRTEQFERDFRAASVYIGQISGYKGHELQRCLEDDHKYLLLVHWEKLEDHTEGFRGSAQYQEWKKMLHDYYDPFPTVEHFERVYP